MFGMEVSPTLLKTEPFKITGILYGPIDIYHPSTYQINEQNILFGFGVNLWNLANIYIGQKVTVEGIKKTYDSGDIWWTAESIIQVEPGEIVPGVEWTTGILPKETETQLTTQTAGLPTWSIFLLLGIAVFTFFGKKKG